MLSIKIHQFIPLRRLKIQYFKTHVILRIREFQTPDIVPVKALYDSNSIRLQIVNAVKQRVDVMIELLFDNVNFRRFGVEPVQEGFGKLTQVCFGAQ